MRGIAAPIGDGPCLGIRMDMGFWIRSGIRTGRRRTKRVRTERLQRMLMNRPSWLGAGDPPSTGWKNGLVKLGRWSLSYYLLHQPVMIGLLAAFVWWRG